MQRNTLFGGLALLAAGGLIGAGAMISSNAMAASDATAPPANELTMINVGADGEAVKCTFSGSELDGMLPDIQPAPVPAGAMPTGGPIAAGGEGVFTVSAMGPGDGQPMQIDPNNPPPGVMVSGVDATTSGAVIVSGSTGASATPESLPEGVQVLSADDAREGTPEECAAMRDNAVTMATQGGGQVITGTAVAGSVTVESGDVTKP